MNEEFAIKLKTVMDESSISKVKEQISKISEVAGEINIPKPRATTLFDPGELEGSSAEVNYLIYQIRELSEVVNAMRERPDAWAGRESEVLKAEAELERLIKKYKQLTEVKEETETVSSVSMVSKTVISVNNGMGEIVKKAKALAGALLGVTTIYGTIRKAMTTYLAQNAELQNKLNACWYALGSLFAPVLEFVINLFVKLVSIVDALAKMLGFAGINMANYGKQAGKASKQLAGFDEINNLSSNSGSGMGNPFGNFDLADKFGEFSALIKGNAELLKLIGIGAMFGIGVALLFTGHPIAGLGMILGAGVLTYREIIPNWDYIGEKVGGVKNAILGLMAGFSIGLGAVLAFSGASPAMGIALMMSGVAMASFAIDWDYLPKQIQQTVAKIMTIVGLATSAIGFLFILFGVGSGNYGLAWAGLMMLAGGLGLGFAGTQMNPNALSDVAGQSIDNTQKTVNEKLPLLPMSFSDAFEAVMEKARQIWPQIKDSLITYTEEIKNSLKQKWADIKSDISQKWADIKANLSARWAKIKNNAFSTFTSIGTKISTIWDSAKTATLNKWSEIRSGLKGKWSSLRSWWSSLSLGGFHISLPHLSWTTGWGGLPRLSVDWYAKGGMFSAPQVIGVGEYSGASNNPEVVAPLETLQSYMNNEETNDLLRELIDVVGSKEFRAYISQSEVGRASVKYINEQSRIKGESIV